MLKSLKELGELALGLFFDSFEMIGFLRVPTPALQPAEIERSRTLQLSALVIIIILSLWAASIRAGSLSFDILTIAAASIIYFSFCSWLLYHFVRKAGLADPQADVRSNALTLTLSFNLIVVFFAAIIRQGYLYLTAQYNIPIPLSQLHIATFTIPAMIAGLILLVRSIRMVGPGGKTVSKVRVTLYVICNIVLADLYLYLILFLLTR